MRVLIIEDEQFAAERMKELLEEYDNNISISAILDSVKTAVSWLNKNEVIDYLLKPIDSDELKAAMLKFNKQYSLNQAKDIFSTEIIKNFQQILTRQYKNRFVIKVGEHLKSIAVEDILYFYSLDKGSYLCTSDNRNFDIDYSLDALAEMLDPQKFFRLNRKYIVCHEAISDMFTYSSSRIKIKLKNSKDDKILVSRNKVHIFKDWLNS